MWGLEKAWQHGEKSVCVVLLCSGVVLVPAAFNDNKVLSLGKLYTEQQHPPGFEYVPGKRQTVCDLYLLTSAFACHD